MADFVRIEDEFPYFRRRRTGDRATREEDVRVCEEPRGVTRSGNLRPVALRRDGQCHGEHRGAEVDVEDAAGDRDCESYEAGRRRALSTQDSGAETRRNRLERITRIDVVANLHSVQREGPNLWLRQTGCGCTGERHGGRCSLARCIAGVGDECTTASGLDLREECARRHCANRNGSDRNLRAICDRDVSTRSVHEGGERGSYAFERTVRGGLHGKGLRIPAGVRRRGAVGIRKAQRPDVACDDRSAEFNSRALRGSTDLDGLVPSVVLRQVEGEVRIVGAGERRQHFEDHECTRVRSQGHAVAVRGRSRTVAACQTLVVQMISYFEAARRVGHCVPWTVDRELLR